MALLPMFQKRKPEPTKPTREEQELLDAELIECIHSGGIPDAVAPFAAYVRELRASKAAIRFGLSSGVATDDADAADLYVCMQGTNCGYNSWEYQSAKATCNDILWSWKESSYDWDLWCYKAALAYILSIKEFRDQWEALRTSD